MENQQQHDYLFQQSSKMVAGPIQKGQSGKQMLDLFFSDLKTKRKLLEPTQENIPMPEALPSSLYEKQNPYDSIFSIFCSLERSKTFRYYEQTKWIHIINSKIETIKDIFSKIEEYTRFDLSKGTKRKIIYVCKEDFWSHQELESIKSWLAVTGGGSLGLGGIHEELPQQFLNFHQIETVNKIFVAIPQSPILKRIIDRLAKLVATDGYIIEQAIIKIEQKNPDFNFLFIKNSDEYIYYRWRVFCFCQGNYPTRLEPFQMSLNGPIWYPPQNIEEYNLKIQIIKETQKFKLKLKKSHSQVYPSCLTNRKLFSKTFFLILALRSIKNEVRFEIAEALIWAYDHSEQAAHIVLMLSESIIAPYSTLQQRLNRLYLLNDILHNSNLPSSGQKIWAFRMYVEHKLPQMFEGLNYFYRHEKNPELQIFFLNTMKKLLKVWNDSLIFDTLYLKGLESTLLREQDLILRDDNVEVFSNLKNPFILKCKQDQIPFLQNHLTQLQSQHLFSLEKLCFQNGLSLCGSKNDLIERLLLLYLYCIPPLTPTSNLPQLLSLIQQFKSFPAGSNSMSSLVTSTQDLLLILRNRQKSIEETDIGFQLILDGLTLDEADWWLYELEGEKEPIDGEPMSDQEFTILQAKDQQTSHHLSLCITELQKIGVYCEEEMSKMVQYRLAQIKNKEQIQKKNLNIQKPEQIKDLSLLQILPSQIIIPNIQIQQHNLQFYQKQFVYSQINHNDQNPYMTQNLNNQLIQLQQPQQYQQVMQNLSQRDPINAQQQKYKQKKFDNSSSSSSQSYSSSSSSQSSSRSRSLRKKKQRK